MFGKGLKYQSHSCLDYLQLKVYFAGDVWRIGLKGMLKCFDPYQDSLKYLKFSKKDCSQSTCLPNKA